MARQSFEQTSIGGSPAAESSMKALLDEFGYGLAAKQDYTRGSKFRAEVIAESNKGFWVSYGGKVEAFAPKGQYGNEQLEVGQQYLFEVVGMDDVNGCVTVGREGARAWEELESAQTQQTVLAVQVQRIQRGDGKISGICVRFGKINGFIPFSLLAIAAGKVEALKDQTLEVLVEELVPEEGRLIFNRRKVEDQRISEQEKQRAELIATLMPGTLIKDLPVLNVASTKDGNEFGIFVELASGIKALVHRTEIPRLNEKGALKNHFKAGDRVDVVVMPIREQNGRKEVALSMKAAQTLQKREFFAANPVGTVLKGKAVRRVDFGVFISLCTEAGVDGLLHYSEFSQAGEPALGSAVEVRIIRVDEQRATVGLSMRATQRA
jgi:ribosomal protein S1